MVSINLKFYSLGCKKILIKILQHNKSCSVKRNFSFFYSMWRSYHYLTSHSYHLSETLFKKFPFRLYYCYKINEWSPEGLSYRLFLCPLNMLLILSFYCQFLKYGTKGWCKFLGCSLIHHTCVIADSKWVKTSTFN